MVETDFLLHYNMGCVFRKKHESKKAVGMESIVVLASRRNRGIWTRKHLNSFRKLNMAHKFQRPS